MSRVQIKLKVPIVIQDVGDFIRFLNGYLLTRGYGWFAGFEVGKNFIVDLLYKKRGRYARPFLHVMTIGLTFLVVTFGPMVLSHPDEKKSNNIVGGVLAASAYTKFNTLQSEEVSQYRGGEIITHTVAEGETISSIARKYGLKTTTILWENNLSKNSKIKPGQKLRILPIDGVRHKVARGETIQSIGKKYGLEGSEIQVIVDYPFNEFLNDETFALATGQYLMIPNGVKKDTHSVNPGYAKHVQLTPDAGSVAATGSFAWPASGRITQKYSFYHKAIDIANHSGGPILAADSGTVIRTGWDTTGYGNRIVVDHGNGYVTLYAHLSVIQVKVGQRVNRGDVLGQMGSTGHSTGTHLHFEIRRGRSLLNPLSFLK